MKVNIITEGGHKYGLGHVTRCFALYQEFVRRGISPELIMQGDDELRDIVTNGKCQTFDWMVEKDRLFTIIDKADIVVVDSYLANRKFYEEMSKRTATLAYIDDNARIDYPRGIVVNGSLNARHLPYPRSKGIKYLLGPQYACVREEFRAVSKKTIKKKVKSVMVIFGGSDVKNVTPKILKLLVNDFPDFTKNVVIGKKFHNTKEILKEKDDKTNFLFYPNAKELAKTMVASNVAISAAGQTLYELFRVGVPTITIAVADNQLQEARYAHTLHLSEHVGYWNGRATLSAVAAALERLKETTLRMERSKRSKKMIDGKGASRIVDFLIRTKKSSGVNRRKAR